MRTVVSWSDVPDLENGRRPPIWDMVFKPDGTILVVASGKHLVFYDAASGDITQSKEAHSGEIYALAASKDGSFLASGGADKTVCVWTYECTMKYTYTHGESIQALAFNPVTHNVLASCSAMDFAIWTMPSPQLKKLRVPSKICCAAWTSDGQVLALGMFNGLISLRDLSGVEKMTINRNAPVWDLSFAPMRQPGPGMAVSHAGEDGMDVLAVACWDGTLSFYRLSGEKVSKERTLGFDPCSARHFPSGEYVVVAGSDKKATLFTRDGIKLATVAETRDWIWRALPRPKTNSVAIASNDGTVSMHTIAFSTVHGLYQDRYAFRDTMTDVVVQHMVTEQRVRIKCRDYVKKIAVYRDRLAVQLPDRIIVYDLPVAAGTGAADGEVNMAYKVKDRIFAALECNLLVVTSSHVILCQERKLQLYGFNGAKEREWVLEAVIRYIKVVGGPPGKEGLLVGLKSGAVLRVFVDNPFPQPVIKHTAAVRCLDMSLSRRKLAVVDELSQCSVYDCVTKELLFAESGANSVAWNAEMENMLCFSGNGVLSIKTGTFPLHTQKMQGFVVGFNGSKIFCLQTVAMQAIDVPQSASLYRYIDARDWEMAYRVACLGVTDSDWQCLGEASLKALQLPIARSCFVRLADMRYLELINHLEAMRKDSFRSHGGDDAALQATLMAEVAAYGGRYGEAGKLHLKGGSVEKAVEMFSDLRLWEEARKFAEDSGGRVDVAVLMLKQAVWCEEIGDAKAAATIFSAIGQAKRAVSILGECGMHNQLIDLVRTFPGSTPDSVIPQETREALQLAGEFFKRAGLPRYAKECYVKLGDDRALIQLQIDSGGFEEALALAQQQVAATKASGNQTKLQAAEALLRYAHLAHAEWLAAEDRMQEAQQEYEIAGRPDLSSRVLQHLAWSALQQYRFADAAKCYAQLSRDSARLPHAAAQSRAFYWLASVYHAYHIVYQSVTMPFAVVSADTALSAARYVANCCCAVSSTPATGRDTINVPYRISLTMCLYAMARQACDLQCFKLARFALDRLSERVVPAEWRDTAEVLSLRITMRPFTDAEEYTPVCYRCGAANGALRVSPISVLRAGAPPPRLPALVTAAADAAASTLPATLETDETLLRLCEAGAADVCVSCKHAFIRSFVAFDVLPLVQFEPVGVTDVEAQQIIRSGRGLDAAVPAHVEPARSTPSNVLSFEPKDARGPAPAAGGAELFNRLLTESAVAGPCVPVPRNVLERLRPDEVFIRRAKQGDVTQQRLAFFKNVIPDIPIVMCPACETFFSADDYEAETLRTGQCPFCSAPVKNSAS